MYSQFVFLLPDNSLPLGEWVPRSSTAIAYGTKLRAIALRRDMSEGVLLSVEGRLGSDRPLGWHWEQQDRQSCPRGSRYSVAENQAR